MAQVELAPPTIQRTELVSQLSASIGQTKANELVSSAAARLGLLGLLEYNKAQALSILDSLAASPGLVGIVARCAKTRVILKFST